MSKLDEYGFKELDFLVFPSEEKTIDVKDDEAYGGAHLYSIQNSIGFKDGKAEYVDSSSQEIQFVHKADDGTMTPGLQSEQLAYVLIDRCQKLNARFPSAFNDKQLAGLKMFIEGCEDRVRDRMDRGVMGDLKK